MKVGDRVKLIAEYTNLTGNKPKGNKFNYAVSTEVEIEGEMTRVKLDREDFNDKSYFAQFESTPDSARGMEVMATLAETPDEELKKAARRGKSFWLYQAKNIDIVSVPNAVVSAAGAAVAGATVVAGAANATTAQPEPDTPPIPRFTIDRVSLGNNRYGLTFGLFINDRGVAGRLNFVPSERIGWRRAGFAATTPNGLFSEDIPDTGRFYVELEVLAGDPNVYITVEGFDIEMTLDCPRFRKPPYVPQPGDPLRDFLYDRWQPMQVRNRATRRVVFGILMFCVFLYTLLVGTLGNGALVVIGLLLTGVVAVTIMSWFIPNPELVRGIGKLLRPFFGKNNWLWGWLAVMSIVSIGFWALTSTPVNMNKPRTTAELVAEDKERRANLRSSGQYKSNREIAELNPPRVDPELVLWVRRWALIILLILTAIYGPIAISDEIKKAYFAIADKFTTNLEGEASHISWLQRTLTNYYGAPVPQADQPAAAPTADRGSFQFNFLRQLLLEFMAETAVEVVPRLVKGRLG